MIHLKMLKLQKKIFDGSGRWSDAWYNTSKKLGLVGVQSGQPRQDTSDDTPKQESGETDYIAQLIETVNTGAFSKALKNFSPKNLTSSQLSQYFGSSGFDANKPTTAHNYGGVTININVPSGNAEDIAAAVKRILQDTNMIEMAASK